ncbi:MAG: hypothetical protein KC417_15600, partial [Myxococcales bacterium]|nr:hypothetical protein [Myxococcales bacterium]
QGKPTASGRPTHGVHVGVHEHGAAAVGAEAALAFALAHEFEELASAERAVLHGFARVRATARHGADTALMWAAHPVLWTVNGEPRRMAPFGSTWEWRLAGPEKWLYNAAHRASVRRLGVVGTDAPLGLANRVLHELHPAEVDLLGARLRALPPEQAARTIQRLEGLGAGEIRRIAVEGDLFERIAAGEITFELGDVIDTSDKFARTKRRVVPITESDEMFRSTYRSLYVGAHRSHDANDVLEKLVFEAPIEGYAKHIRSEHLGALRDLVAHFERNAERLGVEVQHYRDVDRTRIRIPVKAFASY